MYLQLHDNAMSGVGNVPDLILPDAFKVSQRQILTQAAQEGTDLALKELDKAIQKAIDKKNKQAILDELPTIDLDLLDLEEIPEFDETIADRQMAGIWSTILAVGKFLLKYGKIIYDAAMKLTKTVNLVKVNNRIQSYYDANNYQFSQLNNLSKRQIEDEVKMMTGDYLNAVNQKDEVETGALARMIVGYNNRKNSLPFLNQKTMLIGGGLLLAYLLFRK